MALASNPLSAIPGGATGATGFSLRDKQIQTLISMINLNATDEQASLWENPWKVLIFDQHCSDIIAPLLRVGDLRKNGVTLHLLISNSDRQRIPDVPAVYFVAPTPEMIRRICQDCAGQLYDSYHLNFCSEIPRPLLEELAASTLKSNSFHKITKIHEQYCDFITLEPTLFSLNLPRSYLTFNHPSLTDADVRPAIDTIVNSLFSVFITLGVVPIIRCPKNGVAENVARQLDQKIRSHLASSGDRFQTTSFQRPVLILLDRNIDLAVMVRHGWTYQALVHDLLEFQLNRVIVEIKENTEQATRVEKKAYDLDVSDSFWQSAAGLPFPEAAAEVSQQFQEYTKVKEELNRLSLDTGADNEEETARLLMGRTKELGALITSIPELQKKKESIDKHTNIATSLLHTIKDRDLNLYSSYEDALLNKNPLDKKELSSLISETGKGNTMDKLRLYLIYYLASDNSSRAELEEYERVLEKLGCNLKILNHLRTVKAFSGMALAAPIGGSVNRNRSRIGTSFTSNLMERGISSLRDYVQSGVNYLTSSNQEFTTTRIVDSLMEMKNTPETESYLYFDPKISGSAARRNTPFQDAVVFVVGGGNYLEYQNLQDYVKRQSQQRKTKNVIYGTTEMLTATQLISQLNELAPPAPQSS